MATIIKLTYTQTGKATLINFDQVTSTFRIFEKTTRKYATRINFQNDTFAIVDEELQTIKELVENNLTGEYQSNDWVEIDTGGGEDLNDRLENDYHRNMGGSYQPQRPYQRRNNYNNNYNNQRW